jgi:hypothetical protein
MILSRHSVSLYAGSECGEYVEIEQFRKRLVDGADRQVSLQGVRL